MTKILNIDPDKMRAKSFIRFTDIPSINTIRPWSRKRKLYKRRLLENLP